MLFILALSELHIFVTINAVHFVGFEPGWHRFILKETYH